MGAKINDYFQREFPDGLKSFKNEDVKMYISGVLLLPDVMRVSTFGSFELRNLLTPNDVDLIVLLKHGSHIGYWVEENMPWLSPTFDYSLENCDFRSYRHGLANVTFTTRWEFFVATEAASAACVWLQATKKPGRVRVYEAIRWAAANEISDIDKASDWFD